MGAGHAAGPACSRSLGWVRQVPRKEPLMSPSTYRIMEGGAYSPRRRAKAAGSLAPHAPGPSRPCPGDLGRAALGSARGTRLLLADPGTLPGMGSTQGPGGGSLTLRGWGA